LSKSTDPQERTLDCTGRIRGGGPPPQPEPQNKNHEHCSLTARPSLSDTPSSIMASFQSVVFSKICVCVPASSLHSCRDMYDVCLMHELYMHHGTPEASMPRTPPPHPGHPRSESQTAREGLRERLFENMPKSCPNMLVTLGLYRVRECHNKHVAHHTGANGARVRDMHGESF
jgi:hypothetical protein